MNEKYPLVKDKEISDVRKKQVEEDIQKVFEKNLLGRKLINVESINHDNLNIEFFKVGVSSITDKIWFVDEPGGTTFYGYEEIGYGYGEDVAESETKGIIDRIIERVKPENIIHIKEEKLTKDKLIEGFEKLHRSGSSINRIEGNVILTNIYDEFAFWYMDGFKGEGNAFFMGYLELCGKKVQIYYSTLVPKGITLLLDKNKIGTLLVKKTLQISIEDARKLSEDVKEKIIKDIPALTKEELYEKVKILVYEIIGFEIENPDAVVMLKHEIKEE